MEDLPNAPLPLKLPRTALEQSTQDIRRSSYFMPGPGILAGAERLQPLEEPSPMETLAERLSGRLPGDLAAMETPEEIPFNDKDLVELRSICWESLDQNSPPPEAVALIPPEEVTDEVRSSRASSATSVILSEPGGTALAAAGAGLEALHNIPPPLAGPAASLKWYAAEDVSTPKTKRKMQNRAASARFRERARQRATELEICKEMTEKHQKENEMLKEELAAALEALADTRDQLEKCIKQTQETTLQWILSNFKLRRRIHFKTMGKALVWLTGPLVKSSQGDEDAMCTE